MMHGQRQPPDQRVLHPSLAERCGDLFQLLAKAGLRCH
jgi:hypothetical protein